MDAKNESIFILSEIIDEYSSSEYNLKSIMRRCQHVCEIMGWHQSKNWFNQELNGYYSDSELPFYRKIPGTKKWKFDGSLYETSRYETEVFMDGLDPEVYDEQEDILSIHDGIDWFLINSHTGYHEKLSETKEAPSPSGEKRIILRRVRSFSPDQIAFSLNKIEKEVFDWASRTYAQLKYGNKVTDIWDSYREVVDEALQKIDLSDHLSIIQKSIGEDNPEAWRSSVLECRNLLSDLANYLWLDERDTYDLLEGSGPNEKLDVRHGKYSNRLSAYLHQKSITGKEGKFIRDELKRLSISIRSLISLESTAHEPIDYNRSLTIILATYFVIGEISIKTDLEPITEYQNSAP